MDRIKRLSYEVLDAHKSKFGEDFADNKKVLDQISIIRSKGLKNEIAGYITKFIKKEIHDEKVKQKQISGSQALESAEQVWADVAEETVTSETSAETVVEPTAESLAEATEVEPVKDATSKPEDNVE